MEGEEEQRRVSQRERMLGKNPRSACAGRGLVEELEKGMLHKIGTWYRVWCDTSPQAAHPSMRPKDSGHQLFGEESGANLGAEQRLHRLPPRADGVQNEQDKDVDRSVAIDFGHRLNRLRSGPSV